MLLNKKIQFIHQLAKALGHVLLTAGFFFASAAYAYTPPSISDMLVNLTNTVPELMRLVTAIAYVIGFVLILRGIVGLKHFGESRTHHDQGGAKGPLILLAVGACLLYLPGAVHIGIGTFWDNTTPYAYQPSTSSEWSDLIKDVFTIIQLVGTIAFIRGLLMLTKLGGQGGHQATMGKAVTHIIAGIFCINMYQFIQTVMNTLALGQI